MFDFEKKLLTTLFDTLQPKSGVPKIRAALTSHPFKWYQEEVEPPLLIGLHSEIGDVVHTNDNESYIPFIVKRFLALSSLQKPTQTNLRSFRHQWSNPWSLSPLERTFCKNLIPLELARGMLEKLRGFPRTNSGSRETQFCPTKERRHRTALAEMVRTAYPTWPNESS